MKSSFLLDLWRVIDPSEYRILGRFLDSPVHNQRADVRALAAILAEAPPEMLGDMEKEAVFARIFPGQPYDNYQFNYTCSFLVQRLEAFFVWREMEQEPHWRDFFLARALRRRGAFSAYTRRSKRLLENLAAQPVRNADYHLLRFLAERERYQHQVVHERETPTDLSPVTTPLHYFFMLEQLRWAGTALALNARYGVQNQLPFAETALDYASGPDRPAEIELMRFGYETMHDVENEENFRHLKEMISRHGSLFSASENRDLYLLAINFCLRRHNRGERPAYTREALNLYREALEREVLLENEVMQKFTYNNILRLACIAGEWDWAKAFLERYRACLPEEDRENTYRFNLASWHYLAGEYGQVPALLQTFEFTDRDTQLSARQMLLRAYFELGEWQTLDSLLRSFYSFLHRRHDIGYQRTLYLNLIKYTRKVMAARYNQKKARLLTARIRAESNLAEKEWLLEKLATL